MNTTTQNLIILILGIIAIITLIQSKDTNVVMTIIGILGGFLTCKTLTEKQEQIIEERTLDVQPEEKQ